MTRPVLDTLTELAARSVAVVGTCDARNVPSVARAWGLSLENGRLELCIPAAAHAQALANLAATRQAAVTMTVPSTYRSVQVKGRVIELATPSDGDLRRVERHRSAFLAEAALVGLPNEHATRVFAADGDLVKVAIDIDDVFDQTPGPTAGMRL